jgi:hypothetical protein
LPLLQLPGTPKGQASGLKLNTQTPTSLMDSNCILVIKK